MSYLKSNITSVNSKVARNVNRIMILNIIRESQPISRIKIAGITGLNKSTVSSIVSELLKEDLVYEQENIDANVGRNPIDLYLKLNKYFVGAINIDYGLTRIAISDIDGALKDLYTVETSHGDPEKFIEYCFEQLDALAHRNNINNLFGLGISIAGIVDSQKMIVNYAPNLGWNDFNIGEIIKRKYPDMRFVTIGNDAKASALAELWFGDHKVNLSNFVFLSVGTGIGSGIIVNSQIVPGEFQASGEFGHMTLFEGGELCVCGNYGCWEAYASDRATVNRFIEKNDDSSIQVEAVIQDIIDLANSGDAHAIEVLTQTGYYLGVGISNIIKIIDPSAIIIGGKITQVWGIIYPQILNVIEKRAFYDVNKEIKILQTPLKVHPRLLGAATLAIEKIFNEFTID
jgi:predicted NBD/HSP70 family sugar kinase